MAYEMKSDLRVIKTRAAIKSAIKQMICEMPLSEITVKDLTERAMIHRKTFYLHYESIEDLFEDLGNEVVGAYIARIDQLPPDAPYSDINAEFFKFMSEQEPYVEKIYCSPEYGDVLTRMLIEIVQHHKAKGNPYKKFPWEEQEIINTYLVLGSVNIYRTWVRDGKLIPVERLMELASRLMTQGIDSVLKNRIWTDASVAPEDQRPGLVLGAPVVGRLPDGFQFLKDQPASEVRHAVDLYLVPGDQHVPPLRLRSGAPGGAGGDHVAVVEELRSSPACYMASVDSDDQRLTAVSGADDLRIIRIGHGNCEPGVSLGVCECCPADHVQWHRLRVKDVFPAYRVQDDLERRRLYQSGYPAAEPLQERRLGDHGGPAAVGGYDRGVYVALLQGRAQYLRYPEGHVVRGADHPVLGAESEVADAELDVLPHLLG